MTTANEQIDPLWKTRDVPRRLFSSQSSGRFHNWWVHIWGGLVRDVRGKHRKAMGQAIWLYLYLLLGANWKNGTAIRKISTMASQMGSNERTIYRWLRILRKSGYIETRSTGRALKILITKWRPIHRR